MSDLFKYLYNIQTTDNYKIAEKNTLCNKLYGIYISEYPNSYDGSLIEYYKQVFYEKKSPGSIIFDNEYGCISATVYEKKDKKITYFRHGGSLVVNNVHYYNFGHCNYFIMYYFSGILRKEILYNVECYIPNLKIYMNTNTKQYSFRIIKPKKHNYQQ